MAPVTVAVVSWNTRDLLERCLRSLAPEVEAGRAEVWVVDNGSSDGSPELVREHFGWVHLLTPGRNLGFGAAANLVAARTNSRFMAAANADVALEPGALTALLAAADDDPGAGALAPRLLLPDGATQHSVYAFPSLAVTLAHNLAAQRLTPRLADRLCLIGAWDSERPRRVDWAVGAFLLVRREAWNAAGGFDPEQWMYTEDLDLGWRLARAGWGVRYVPGARVRHEESAATTQAWGAERVDRWQEATYTWLRRHRGRGRARVYAAVSVAGAGARALLTAPLARLAPGRFEVAHGEARAWTRRHLAGLRG